MRLRNTDEHLRRLERAAQAGDPDAQARLDRERRRAGIQVARARAETPDDLVREIRAWWKTKEPEHGDLSYEVTFWTADGRFDADGVRSHTGRGWAWKGEQFGNDAPLNMTSEGGFNRVLCYGEGDPSGELVEEWNQLIESLGWRWETNTCWAFSFYPNARKNPGGRFGATLAKLDARHTVAGRPRRNADDRLRALERAWRTSPDDERAWWCWQAELARIGQPPVIVADPDSHRTIFWISPTLCLWQIGYFDIYYAERDGVRDPWRRTTQAGSAKHDLDRETIKEFARSEIQNRLHHMNPDRLRPDRLRNADDRLRALERQAEVTHAPQDVEAFMVERLRVGADVTAALDGLLGRLLTDTFDRANPAGKKVRHTALNGLASSLLAMTTSKAVKDNFRLFHYVFGELGLVPMVRDGIWITLAHRRVPYRVGIDPVREFQELWAEVVTDDPEDEALLAWARSGAPHSVRALVPEVVEYARLLKRRLAADDL